MLQIAYELEKYHTLNPHFSLGTYLKAYYSSRNFSHNYRATMMQAGEFAPTAHIESPTTKHSGLISL